jgi:hypothetical protein
VAASTDITGSEERGGDCEIEFAYETVEAQPLQSLPDSIEYRELLENNSDKGTLTGTPDVDALTGEDNSNDTLIGLAGDDTLDLSALAGNPPAGAQAAAGGRGLLSAHSERRTMSLLHRSKLVA